MHGVSLHCVVLKCLRNSVFWVGGIYEIVDVKLTYLCGLASSLCVVWMIPGGSGGQPGEGLLLPLTPFILVSVCPMSLYPCAFQLL